MQLNQNIINKQSEIKSLDYKLASKNDELDELIETITEFKSEYERIKSATSNNKKEKKRKLTADDLPKSNNNRYH